MNPTRAQIRGGRHYYGKHKTPGWHYRMWVVDAEGKVVLDDDARGARGWAALLDDASKMVAAVRVVERKGHRLRSWDDVVTEAGDF